MEKNKKMIAFIIIFAAAAVICGSLFFLKSVGGRKPTEEIHSYKTIKLKINGMRGTREYEINCQGEISEISLYRYFYTNRKEERRLEKSAFIGTEEMINILNFCKFADWNGFKGKHPKNVHDGDMFRLEAVINENKTITAEGSANFPNGYNEFLRQIGAILAD